MSKTDNAMDVVHYFNGRPTYLDRDGTPMTLRQWAMAYSDFEARTLARTEVGDRVVMTMWMGLDTDPLGPVPMIFGSIIRRGKTWGDEIESPTEDAAMEAHRVLVVRVTSEVED